MRDDRKFRIASTRLAALRGNIPKEIPENLVTEYHALLDELQDASEEDLSAFRIAPAELKQKSFIVPMFVTGGPPPTPILSDERICDSNLFARQVNALGHYLTAIQQSPRTPTQPESPTDYWSMSTSELEDLAHKYQIGGYGYSVHGGVDRQTIIDALLKRDRAIRADTPAPRQTINVGKMEHSVIQQGTHSSTATATHTIADQKALLAKLRDAVPQLGLNAEDEEELKTDVSTLELQLSSKNPKPSVVRECWISVRGILEKAAGSLLAAGILHEISRFLSH